MASSVKYTLEEARVLDTILHGAIGLTEAMPKWSVILFIYLIVLVMNFFIPSGSAKAFMLIPLIVPIASIFDISAQLYKANCPPVVLVKPPLIASRYAMDFLCGKIKEAIKLM